MVEIIKKTVKDRNFSFLGKNTEEFDNFEFKGVNYIIPATIGSTFWAIIKVLYQHENEKIYYDTLTSEVEELMRDRDEDSWNRYINKKEITIHKKLTDTRELKPIAHWKDRIISNARTLCRKRDYGKRLIEIGFKLVHNKNKDKNYFVLEKTESI